MNDKCFTLAAKRIGKTYAKQAEEAKNVREAKVTQLLEQGKLPLVGWSDPEIEMFLADLAMMDSNNFSGNCGVGEREARIYSSLVARRNYQFGHGVGRSGDLCEVQPKAAGSSLMSKLTNSLLLDLIKLAGVGSVKDCFLVPMATGMSLTLCMLTIKKNRPDAKYVIWSRIDQKSCFKSILTAGLEPVVIELVRVGDELQTDVDGIRAAINRLGASAVACVFTTTSCFAPRAPDSLPEVAKICAEFSIPHITNNAYGIQSSKCMYLIQEANRVGRLDAFVQSTDKNLMVPVGGAVIAGFNKDFLGQISRTYPGRASSSPVIDVFITLLCMGVKGFKDLMARRKVLYGILKEEMKTVAEKHKLKVLETKNNTISIAMTVSGGAEATNMGSMLFIRGVSGTRVVTGKDEKSIENQNFTGWGSHSCSTDSTYLTAAAGVGMEEEEVKLFIKRLDKVLEKVGSEGDKVKDENNGVKLEAV